MTDITQCPECGTHFRISTEQRNSHQGMVRCGQCQTVFNAVANLYTPPEQLALPLDLDEIDDVPAIHTVYDPYGPDDTDSTSSTVSISSDAARRANDFSHLADVHIAPAAKPASPLQIVLWSTASLLLLLVLLLQTAYLLRVEIAARLPGIKPALLLMCKQLNCTIPLPQKIDLLSIESSELEADPNHDDIITLHALLRSRAPYELAYPNIELTLTDTQDNALARRNFDPSDYLPASSEEAPGFPANREISIKLHLNTTDLKPAGYRLFLFYPQ